MNAFELVFLNNWWLIEQMTQKKTLEQLVLKQIKFRNKSTPSIVFSEIS